MSCACGCGPSADRCRCCEGARVIVPEARENRPGLSRLSYRIGTHGSFLASLQARLTSHELVEDVVTGAGEPVQQVRARPLARFGVRANDATPALLDAWAMVGDVLTFYQERIANEGYLRTATEARSLHELAALPGYAPRPGVAASTYLAFDIDANTRGDVSIPAGSRTQTIPGQDETPQSFETADTLTARAEWNRLSIRRRAAQAIADLDRDGLWLAGTTTRLRAGNPLLIAADGATPEPYRITAVREHPDFDSTELRLEPWVPQANTLRALTVEAPSDGAIDGVRARLALLDEQRPETLNATLEEVRATLGRRVSPPARRWLNAVAERIGDMTAAPAAAIANNTQDTAWSRLLTQPSRPLPDVARLPRDAVRELGTSSGGMFALLSAANPQLARTLAPALAGYRPPAGVPALRVFALRVHAGAFGRNFPRRTAIVQTRATDTTTTSTVDVGDWSIVSPARSEEEALVHLDAAYDQVTPGSWLLIDMRAVKEKSARVTPTAEVLVAQAVDVLPKLTRAAYGQSGETTDVTLDRPWLTFGDAPTPGVALAAAAATDDSFAIIRRTAIYAGSEELTLADAPVSAPVCDGTQGLALDTLALGIEPGRLIAIGGTRADIPGSDGVPAAEVAMVAEVVHSDDAQAAEKGAAKGRSYTTITLEKPLAYCYRRETLTVFGNVVRATHGQTRREPMGSGDATIVNQGFVLKHAPVTYLPAATPAGAVSSVAIHVDDVAWKSADSFVDRKPTDRLYVETVRADGSTVIRFGDGAEGARLPTGTLNLDAVYREGIGKTGNVRAGQISQLADRPLGVREVVNPVPGTGGADPEGADLIRRNVPIASVALGRLVALRDYADFARGFAGIEKATATSLPVGRRRLVHVTLAGIDDIPIDLESDLMRALRRALRDLGDPTLPVAVATREYVPVVLQARIAIDADRRWERISKDVRAALTDALGFHARGFGQTMAASEVVTLIQRVPGVARVHLDLFGALPAIRDDHVPEPDTIAAALAGMGSVAEVIASRPARLGTDGAVLPAQIVAIIAGADQTIVLNQQM